MNLGPIVLTTDFGNTDEYVGVLKGVILSINPTVRIIDLNHAVPPQDISRAAHLVGRNRRYFPAGAIHLCIVDPGVGSNRRIIVVKDTAQFYIGPDNGVFSSILSQAESLDVYELTNESWFLEDPGTTFHGRDIMAPAAARISLGEPIKDAGPPVDPATCVIIPPCVPLCSDDRIIGEIIHIDHFGNLVSNIDRLEINRLSGAGNVVVQLRSARIPFKQCSYADLAENEVSAIINSSDLLEICVKNGNGAALTQARKGDRVILSRGAVAEPQ
ncbi:MAG: SAM-dependent chlorinase/fluorinase [Desulfofustis sp.]